MSNDLFNAAVWEKAWTEDPNATGNKMKKAGIGRTSFDHKAKIFNAEVFSAEGRHRSERIIRWIEGQGVDFQGLSVLDIGAASGGFTVPFVDRGARVTAVEPNVPLSELFRENTARFDQGQVELVHDVFEELDIDARGWNNAYDLVFVSMCPVIVDWESVERVLSTARKYCYISVGAGPREHSLLQAILPLLTGREVHPESSDMAYLTHLLYLKGYSFESIITKETKTTESTYEEAIEEVMQALKTHNLNPDESTRQTVTEYVHRTYPDGKVVIHQSGRYGKVLIRLQELNMYTRPETVRA
ncbi:class I SAM-dependent methyltransferase [Paenibacillus sp. Leaf72]|uniref:class I SAM-dependent methyltransferase n=1 Tax=Paenibacillus sp. Leaf72 TaxID=1736234 RepID=UPI0006F20E5B|nr:class I SAM-dependent methyltransferase [Paenibacillus sp. Leaf72]KQO18662.1 SAM-dependent methyltransferase [Paenibacillus sp. Leaf72]